MFAFLSELQTPELTGKLRKIHQYFVRGVLGNSVFIVSNVQ